MRAFRRTLRIYVPRFVTMCTHPILIMSAADAEAFVQSVIFASDALHDGEAVLLVDFRESGSRKGTLALHDAMQSVSVPRASFTVVRANLHVADAMVFAFYNALGDPSPRRLCPAFRTHPPRPPRTPRPRHSAAPGRRRRLGHAQPPRAALLPRQEGPREHARSD